MTLLEMVVLASATVDTECLPLSLAAFTDVALPPCAASASVVTSELPDDLLTEVAVPPVDTEVALAVASKLREPCSIIAAAVRRQGK